MLAGLLFLVGGQVSFEHLAKLPLLTAKSGNGDFRVSAPYVDGPELTVREGVPKGKVYRFVMDSRESKVYPGIAKGQTGVVPYTRRVTVYVPSQVKASSPFFVSQDSMGASIMPTMLDNMIFEKRVPAMVGIFI